MEKLTNYKVTILIDDLNVKVRREDIGKEVTGMEGLHENSYMY